MLATEAAGRDGCCETEIEAGEDKYKEDGSGAHFGNGKGWIDLLFCNE